MKSRGWNNQYSGISYLNKELQEGKKVVDTSSNSYGNIKNMAGQQ